MQTSPFFVFRFSFFVFPALLALGGCGVPGDPRPPRPVVPTAVKDLTVQQGGGHVVLTFTLPERSTEGEPLADFPALEIYRGYAPAATTPDKLKEPERLVYTIPPAVVDTYLVDRDPAAAKRIRFEDPIRPQDLAAHGDEQWVYAVRTRASERKNSAPSNIVAVRVLPVPPAPDRVWATVTEPAIELRWTPVPPSATLPVSGYRVYRADIILGKEGAAESDPTHAELAGPPRLLAVAPTAGWDDTTFEFSRGYLYTVRSVGGAGPEPVESGDSPPVVVVPRDTFPPAPPVNLVAVFVPATAASPAAIELSWGISAELDLAGYHVYRSDGTEDVKLSTELLLAPTFRDTSVAPGRRYSYRVTATDRAGNESQPSAPVSEAVPSP